MKLYHRTTQVAAQAIATTGQWQSLENTQEVFFSNRPDGHATGYGGAVVSVNIPDYMIRLDDEFPDGEQHFAVKLSNLKGRQVHVTWSDMP